MRYVGAALLTILAVLLGCAPAPQASTTAAPAQQAAPASTSSGPKRIVASVRGDPFTIADAINAAGGGRVAGVRDLEMLTNSGLGLVDPQGQMSPLLAVRLPTTENGAWEVFPDGRMRTTWKLKPNVVWHDGQPFTSADLAFSVQVGRDKNLTIVQDIAYEFIDTVETPDPLTFVVNWKKTFVEADTLLTRTERARILPMARHVLAQPYADEPTALLQNPYFAQDFVGTGPYRIKQWVPGSHIVLAANDRFVMGRPKLDEVEVKFLWDTNVIVSNILAGAVEMTIGEGLSVEQAIMARDQWRDGRVEIPLETMTGLWPQFINPDPPAMTDVRFRRAMLHAIDRKEIVDSFLAGMVPVADSFISPTSPEYDELQRSVVRYDYDPNRARQLIQSVGLMPGADGIFMGPDGRPLTVEIRTTAHELREKLVPVLGDYWKKAGVLHDPIIIPRQRAADREYRATSKTFDFRFNPPEVTRYHSNQIPLPENDYRGNNSARYRSAELDGMLDRYVVTIQKSERTKLLAQIINHMTDQLVVYPLFHDAEPVLIGNRILNVGSKRGDSLQSWNAKDWDVK